MMRMKKFVLTICVMFLPVMALFAQSSKAFVCRVVPNENDAVYKMLKSVEARLEEYNYNDEALNVRTFLSTVGNMGVVISDESGKKYVLTSGDKSLSDFTGFDIRFVSDGDSESVVLKDLKLSALDGERDFLLIELPRNYSGKALRLNNTRPELGQKVEIPNFNNGYWENQLSMVVDVKEEKTYFLHSNQFASVGTPVLLHDGNSDSAYTLLGVNRYLKNSDRNSLCAEKNSSINEFMKKWPYTKVEDTDLPLNLFISMISEPYSNKEKIASRFISAELLLSKGADFFISDTDYHRYGNDFKKDPYKDLAGLMTKHIGHILKPNSILSVSSVEESGNSAKVVFSNDGKLIDTAWVKENGLWKISDVEGLDERINIKKKTSYGYLWDVDDGYYGDPYVLNLRGSYLVSTDSDNRGFDVSALLNAQFFGFGLFYQQDKFPMELSSGTQEHTASTFGGLVRFQLPIDIWCFMIVPFVEGRLGFTNVHELFDDKSSRLFAGINYGVDLAFVINPYLAPYVSFSGNAASYNDREHSNNLSFAAGLRLLGVFDISAF